MTYRGPIILGTPVYDRNTASCKSSYFSVNDRLRLCKFDLGTHDMVKVIYFNEKLDYVLM